MSVKKRLLLSVLFFIIALTLIFTFIEPGILSSGLLAFVVICINFIMKFKRKDNNYKR